MSVTIVDKKLGLGNSIAHEYDNIYFYLGNADFKCNVMSKPFQ